MEAFVPTIDREGIYLCSDTTFSYLLQKRFMLRMYSCVLERARASHCAAYSAETHVYLSSFDIAAKCKVTRVCMLE